MDIIQKKENILENPLKNNNNNNDNHNFRWNYFPQLDLSGQPIKQQIKLKGFQKYFLEIFYENQKIGLTQTHLFNAICPQFSIHKNSVNNFITSALVKGWIYRTKPIQGNRISNAYMDIKEPDYLSTGQIVSDKRFKYYRITKLGIKIYEAILNSNGDGKWN